MACRDSLEGTQLILSYLARSATHSRCQDAHDTPSADGPLESCSPAASGGAAAEMCSHEAPTLYGASPLEACRVDQWLAFVVASFVPGPAFEQAAVDASNALALRTYLVGDQLTIADVGAWGALESCPLWTKV